MQQLPGTVPHALGLLQEMARARAARGPNYKPRTRHLRADGWAKYTNRLFLESSPYLLQHAHNPVNWYPWGDAAFQEAKRQNKPVLLSIGYSTCHWCHVMEKESFEDEEIAKFMNENYIAIKVDREERPDLDAIYMAAVQALTGRGGWPMTVWLTPDRRPFYGGTYFPARDGDRGAQIGFLTLLSTLREIYTTEPRKVAQAEAELANVIQRMLVPAGGNLVPVEHVLETAFEIYESRFDSVYGGLKTAPKFPSSLPIRILLRDHRRTGNPKALKMATLTLEKMASGGMYDHIGGGFHRYSTDAYWLVPHFEKMLYDNALLTLAYLEGYQVTGRSDFRRIVREILSYVERDMMAPEGGFYSATDADSLNLQGHLEEGWYFTWTPAELEAVLDKKDSQLVAEYYGVTAHGNFEGRNILNTPNPISEVAKKFAQGEQSTSVMIDLAKHRLYRARGQRLPPIRDEKILTAWNGLMISAYAQTGLALGEKHYLQRAQQAARFIAENLYQDGRLSRSYKDGKAHINGYLDDYAFFIRALLDLYEATGNLHWFELAIALDRTLENHYEDKISGGYFMTSDDHEKLLAREKPVYDGALPSGNSVAMTNLLRLYEFTSDDRYRKRAEKALRFSGDVVTRAPEGQSELLLALDFYYDTPKQIVIVTAKHREEAEPLLSTLGGSFVPNRIVVTVVQDEATENHGKYIPLVNQKVAIKGQPTAYVCEGGICQLPTTDPGVFTRQITAMKMGE